jgi:predicted nucleotidyltransferase
MKLTFSEIQSAVTGIISDKAEFCFLLGSAATPFFRDDSDVDIAVYWTNEDIPISKKAEVSSELSDRLGREVDLISLNDIDVVYGIQVIDKGRILLSQNPGLMLQWKANIISQYPDFKASRLIIEENILKRKKYV